MGEVSTEGGIINMERDRGSCNTERDVDTINSEIKEVFEKIGRVVVYAEKLRYQLLNAIAVAEFDRSIGESEWPKLGTRLRKKYESTPLGDVVARFERAFLKRYDSDESSRVVIYAVSKQCIDLISDRNDVTHSLWSIGWRFEDCVVSESFRFDRKDMTLKDVKLEKRLDDMIARFRITLHTINGMLWDAFQNKPLSLCADPGPFVD
jgi:hypothetical protein